MVITGRREAVTSITQITTLAMGISLTRAIRATTDMRKVRRAITTRKGTAAIIANMAGIRNLIITEEDITVNIIRVKRVRRATSMEKRAVITRDTQPRDNTRYTN
jgi:hypothetical protein